MFSQQEIGNYSKFRKGKIRNFAVTPVANGRCWFWYHFPSHPPVPVVEIEADDAELPYLGGIGASIQVHLLLILRKTFGEIFTHFRAQTFSDS